MQNAKYVSIKMIHICHAMQFVTILCHTIAYQQNARTTYAKYICVNQNVAYLSRNAIYDNIMPYYSNTMTYYAYQQNAKNTYAKYVSIKMLHTCHAMQFITILWCHIIAYQQIL